MSNEKTGPIHRAQRGPSERPPAVNREMEVKADTTMGQLLDELQLSSAPIMVQIGDHVFNPKHITERTLVKGDKITFIRPIAGG